jgi:Cu/Ag efflux pump CusA
MTALATALALAPLVVNGNRPGQEIEYPMAIVILGGLATSTVLNLFILPALYLAFGHRRSVNPPDSGVVTQPEPQPAGVS